jgi:hypothetical protein
MAIVISLITLIKFFATSLGVGASTLAAANYFVAVADGYIDENERRMMGVVYVVLRIAMAIILVTSIMQFTYEYSAVGLGDMHPYTLGQMLVLFVLYLNALLMTAHLVPNTVGPALQAGSWYTLGTLLALQSMGYVHFTFLQLFLAYATWIILAVGIVNGILAVLKEKRSH